MNLRDARGPLIDGWPGLINFWIDFAKAMSPWLFVMLLIWFITWFVSRGGP